MNYFIESIHGAKQEVRENSQEPHQGNTRLYLNVRCKNRIETDKKTPPPPINNENQ